MAQPEIDGADDREVNKLIEEGCRRLRVMEKPSYTTVIKAIHEETGKRLPYATLRRRFLGLTKPRSQAHVEQQLLSPAAEKVLVDWTRFYALTSSPLSKRAIRNKALAICGKLPTRSWTRSLLARWPSIKLGKPSGLDPKRANCFNKPTVMRYARVVDAIVTLFRIPIENYYNMDEKGCQRGGGRKASSRKYFVPRDRRPSYRARSANLELVTIIECVCVDGTALLPGFVFSGKEFCSEWFDVDVGGELWIAGFSLAQMLDPVIASVQGHGAIQRGETDDLEVGGASVGHAVVKRELFWLWRALPLLTSLKADLVYLSSRTDM